ncbi:hypothetical protein ACJX0J_019335, partial [Zea mays]
MPPPHAHQITIGQKVPRLWAYQTSLYKCQSFPNNIMNINSYSNTSQDNEEKNEGGVEDRLVVVSGSGMVTNPRALFSILVLPF